MAEESLARRFWDKVDKRSADQCWPWMASLNAAGYGQLGSGGKRGRPYMAQRVSWMINRGPIPSDMCVLHRCDNPRCVNPEHLFLGTQTDNMFDCIEKGRLFMLPVKTRANGNGNAKIDQKRADEIVARFKSGEVPSKIAKDYGIDRTTVYKIVRSLWSEYRPQLRTKPAKPAAWPRRS